MPPVAYFSDGKLLRASLPGATLPSEFSFMSKIKQILKFKDLTPGDRIIVLNKEFKDWIPTEATVLTLGIKFPASEPPMRRLTIRVRLDKHPFPEIFWQKIRDLGWEEDSKNMQMISIQ